MARIESVDKIVDAVESNETSVGIFLNLPKAFGTINHDILLVLKCITQITKFIDLVWCIHQGSILIGPLLFILYILSNIVNTTYWLELTLFADETTLLFSYPDISLQNDIANNKH